MSPPTTRYIDGKCLACTYRAKFVEVSVGINHNVDELLAGTLTQIRLKKEHCELQVIVLYPIGWLETVVYVRRKRRSGRDEKVKDKAK